MSDQDKPEAVEQPEETQVTDRVAELEKRLADAEKSYKKEVSGLNRRNTELETMLKAKDEEKLSAQELMDKRLADLESRYTKAEQDRKEIEAFTRAGLSVDWRDAISATDPEDRAAAIKRLLDASQKLTADQIAKKLTIPPPAKGEDKTAPGEFRVNKDTSPADLSDAIKSGLFPGLK